MLLTPTVEAGRRSLRRGLSGGNWVVSGDIRYAQLRPPESRSTRCSGRTDKPIEVMPACRMARTYRAALILTGTCEWRICWPSRRLTSDNGWSTGSLE